MVQKTGAEMLFGYCIRNADQSGFNVMVEKPEFEIHDRTVEDFNAAMNLQMEGIINRWPNQYQWTYKRFKRQPEGNNPYDFG